MPLKVKKIRVGFPSYDSSVDGDMLFNIDAEAWARGTQNGQPIPAPNPPDDSYPHSQNNAKYYSEIASHAQDFAGDVINNWMDQHSSQYIIPDGSISFEKLQDGTLGYVTPDMYDAVDANGIINIDNFNTMLVQAAENHKKIVFTRNMELQFQKWPNDGNGISNPGDDNTQKNRGNYYKGVKAANGTWTIQPHPVRLVLKLSDDRIAQGLIIDGRGYTISMTGLTRSYQEEVYDQGGTAYDFFVGLSLYSCNNLSIQNLNIKGEFEYYNYPHKESGSNEIIPVDKMGYDSARAIGLALRGCENVSISNCNFKGILGNGINMKSTQVGSIMRWTRGVTISNCTFRDILEDSSDNMAGAQGVTYTNCIFYNTKQGIETAQQNTLTNMNYNDGSIYAGDPFLYSTTVSNCWFQSCDIGMISNATDCISNCTFIETPIRVGASSRSVWSNCIVRPNNISMFYGKGSAKFNNVKFIYPRIATGLLAKITAASTSSTMTIKDQAGNQITINCTQLTVDNVKNLVNGTTFTIYDKNNVNKIQNNTSNNNFTVGQVNKTNKTIKIYKYSNNQYSGLATNLEEDVDGIYGYLYSIKYREYDYTHDKYWLPDLANDDVNKKAMIYAVVAQADHEAGLEGPLEFSNCTFEFGDRFQIWTSYRTIHFSDCLFKGGTLTNGEYIDITGDSTQSIYLNNTKIEKIVNAIPYRYELNLISSGTDMNNLLDETKEYEYRGGTGNVISNIPSNLSAEIPFRLFVHKLNHSASRSVSQIILTAPTGAQGRPAIYQRVWRNTGWSSWIALTGDNDSSSYEQTSNKVTSISDSSTDTQYPSAKAVWSTMEAKTNKVTSISGSSTDTQYPSAKAVWDTMEAKANRVTEITRIPTNQQYPTAKAVKDAMDSVAAVSVPANTAVTSWKTNKGIQWANGTESGFSNGRWQDTSPIAVPFGATRLIYSQVTLTDASSNYGLAFYKSTYDDTNTSSYAASYISGVQHLVSQAALGTRINTVDIPPNAAYVRITYGTASYNAAFDGTFYCAFVNAAGEILYNLLTTPEADGTYVLKATVNSGNVTYEWVVET